MKALLLVAFVYLQAAEPAPVPGMPVAAGVYYRQSDGKWTGLEQPVASKSKTKGMGLFIETDGLSNLDMTTVFAGAQARVQIPTARPVLCVRGVGSAKEAIVVQLARRKDSRALQTSKSAATVENKGGFKKSEIRKVTVTVYSDDSFCVTPDNDLKSGEYLLAFGNADGVFDFGITARGK